MEVGNFPGMPGAGNMQGAGTVAGNVLLYGVCLILAVAALIFATKYKRK